MPTAISLSDRVEIELLTADEFLDWLKPEVHADLIDGKKTVHTPVSLRHARLVNFLHTLLTLFAEAKGIGEVHREVVAVRLRSRNVFLPDVNFFSSEQVPRMKENTFLLRPFGFVKRFRPTLQTETSARSSPRMRNTEFKNTGSSTRKHLRIGSTHPRGGDPGGICQRRFTNQVEGSRRFLGGTQLAEPRQASAGGSMRGAASFRLTPTLMRTPRRGKGNKLEIWRKRNRQLLPPVCFSVISCLVADCYADPPEKRNGKRTYRRHCRRIPNREH